MIDPSAGDSVEAETKTDDNQATPAAGSQGLTSVGSQLTAAPPASFGNAGTRSVATPTNLAARPHPARAAEKSAAMSAPPPTQTETRTSPRPDAPAMEETMFELHPGVATPLASLCDASAEGTLALGAQLSEAQQCEYVDSQVAQWTSRGPTVVSPPDPYYPERRHWPMRNWLMEMTEAIRPYSTSPASPSSTWSQPGELGKLRAPHVPRRAVHIRSHLPPGIPPQRAECLEPDRGRQRFSVRREDVPFQVLDPKAAASFPVEEDGDVLMLTVEEHEFLGNDMVIRLRLAQSGPEDPTQTSVVLSPTAAEEALTRRYRSRLGLALMMAPASGAARSRRQ
ncbi:hypothetical protein PHYPSEUDO_007799 [Phytophthora pseudosyringae]|uniref:Uncharacterized protein n=1 Tax=Phytophthora pseudosyringae TaxID=221518 RepID=A0A8T1VIW8_9STRA|nr:hypothetical protein PHYPSEUDO_007799 [Phytophthora pseudosyringae]